jgi:hypothetical protein
MGKKGEVGRERAFGAALRSDPLAVGPRRPSRAACANEIEPVSLRTPCDLGGFFSPYAERGRPDVVAAGAREHPHSTLYALYALSAHPDLQHSLSADRFMVRIRDTQHGNARRVDVQGLAAWWQGASLFAALQAVADLDLPLARQLVRDALAVIAPGQRKDGAFGPCAVERVAAVLWTLAALRSA